MPKGYSSKSANDSRAKVKEPDSQVRDWKYNAEEYADIKTGEGWVFARLVACSVRPGDGQGQQPRKEVNEVRKVSARTFAKQAHTTAPTVLKYLELWTQAFNDPNVPEVWIDPDKMEPWQAADDEVELPKVDFKIYRAEQRVVNLTAPKVEVVQLPVEDRPLLPAPKSAVKATPLDAGTKLQFVDDDVVATGLSASSATEAAATPLQNPPNKIHTVEVGADLPLPAATTEAPLRDFMIKRFSEWDDYTEGLIQGANRDELKRFVNHMRKVADQINDRLSGDQ